MQYGEPVHQGNSNSSLEVLTFPEINVSGHNFNIMNTLHEFAAKPAQCWKQTCSIFQITISKLHFM